MQYNARLFQEKAEINGQVVIRMYLPSHGDSIHISTDKGSIRFINPIIQENGVSKTKEVFFMENIAFKRYWKVNIISFKLESEYNNHFNGPIEVELTDSSEGNITTIKCNFAKIM
ncbi:hypothetical protein BD770DRAFT_400422 [Pilaira anomala]|nr:hypothetical protein BD770DRAFT_400422 [Pilaira anomala]